MCVVGGDSVRYRVIPWNDELARPMQRQVLAEQCFVEAYGEVARDWTVRDHAQRYGAATLACGVDTALLDRLDASAQSRGLQLSSLQPSLMRRFNRHLERGAGRSFEPGMFWFVWIEAGGITVLLASPAEPIHVKQIRGSGADLARVLDREWFALGLDVPRCPVYIARSAAVTDTPKPATVVMGWSVVDLPERHDGDAGRAASRAAARSLGAQA